MHKEMLICIFDGKVCNAHMHLFIAPTLLLQIVPKFEDVTLFFLCSSQSIDPCSVSGIVLDSILYSDCIASLSRSSGRSESRRLQFGP